MSLPEQFWSKVTVGKEDDCWLWTAATGGGGYGKIHTRGRYLQAHRVAWELTSGMIPEGANVLHGCDQPLCVNPTHLSLGSFKDNTRDMINKDRHPRIKKDHCAKGHPYTDKNTYRRPDRPSDRLCRECRRLACRRYYNSRKVSTA